MDTQLVQQLVIVAMVIEATIETVAQIKEQGVNWQKITAFVVGGLLSFLFGLDVLSYVGLDIQDNLPPVVGDILNPIFLGIMMARYSGAINDLLDWLNKLRGSNLPTGASAK